MRYLFKTDYRQDTTIWRHSGDLFWYGLLCVVLLVIPFVLGEFYVGELGGVFVFAVAGVGMIFQKWDAVTGGFDGFAVPAPDIFGIPVQNATGIYYLSLAVLVLVLWFSANLLRTPLGRAMVAIRDSE